MNYKTSSTILLTLSICFFVSGCKSEIEKQKWFRYAKKFDRARIKMIKDDLAKKGTIIEDQSNVLKWRRKYLETRQPTEEEIVFVLSSPNRNVQKIGLAAMLLKPIESEQLIYAIFKYLDDQDSEFRYYSAMALVNLKTIPEFVQHELKNQLIQVIKNRGKNDLLVSESMLLAKFPSKETSMFLIEHFIKKTTVEAHAQDRLSKHIAFRALKEMGESYFNDAADYIDKHGSSEAKEKWMELEESYKDWQKVNQ